ncbi:MAG: YbaY family lipoprotein [Acidimicrobiales bacterium]
MSRTVSLLAAAAMTLSLAACAADDSEGATSAGTESSAEGSTETTAETGTEGTEGEAATDEEADSDEADGADAVADSLPVTGELSYDATSVDPGSTLTLTLTDLADANADTALISEETIELDDPTSPIAFEISVPREGLDPLGRYSLRALISDADGTALLTTNSANFIDPGAEVSDLGSLNMVSAD